MSKSPAFQWYAADYLADERVMLMTLEAEGAYVRLLSLCWREGSIPANPALLSAMCKQADPKVIKEVLPCFTKVGAPTGRLVHKRLEEERAKQLAHRAKQAENGRNGGRPKKAVGKPNETQKNPPLSFGETQTEPNESSSFSSSFSSSSNDERLAGRQAGEGSASPVESPPAAGTVGGPARQVFPDAAEVFTRNGFREFVKSIGFGGIDIGYYLVQIQQAAGKEEKPRPNSGKGLTWESFVKNYLHNDRLHNRLVAPVPADGQPGAQPQQQRYGAPTPSTMPGDLRKIAAAQQNPIM